MRRTAFLVLSLAVLTAAKPKADPKPASAPPTDAPPIEAPTTAPTEAPPADPPTPKAVSNADLQVTLTWANGTTRAVHVTGVERTVDFNGYQGWTTDARKLVLTVESGATERDVAWADIATIAITPGKAPDDVDCTYDSSQSTTMYECTLRTTAAVTLKDGTKGNITSRHRWRFTIDGGETIEVQPYKYTVTIPEDAAGTDEASGPFAVLQARISADVKAGLLKTIAVR